MLSGRGFKYILQVQVSAFKRKSLRIPVVTAINQPGFQENDLKTIFYAPTASLRNSSAMVSLELIELIHFPRT